LCQTIGNRLFANRVVFTEGVVMLNIAEKARKLAKLPAIGRKGATTPSGRVTQDMLADLYFAVEIVGGEVAEEMEKLKDTILDLRDTNHSQAMQINKLERSAWAESVKGNVRKTASALDLQADQTKALVSSVSA